MSNEEELRKLQEQFMDLFKQTLKVVEGEDSPSLRISERINALLEDDTATVKGLESAALMYCVIHAINNSNSPTENGLGNTILLKLLNKWEQIESLGGNAID